MRSSYATIGRTLLRSLRPSASEYLPGSPLRSAEYSPNNGDAQVGRIIILAKQSQTGLSKVILTEMHCWRLSQTKSTPVFPRNQLIPVVTKWRQSDPTWCAYLSCVDQDHNLLGKRPRRLHFRQRENHHHRSSKRQQGDLHYHLIHHPIERSITRFTPRIRAARAVPIARIPPRKSALDLPFLLRSNSA